MNLFDWKQLVVLSVAVAMTAAGCAKEPAPKEGVKVPVQELPPPEGNTEPPLSDVSDAVNSIPAPGTNPKSVDVTMGVTLIAPGDYAAAIGKHKGKVVLVDFWATWCAPCVKGFPHTVELARKLADRGLSVVTVSLDDPDSKSDVEAFLAKAGANFDNYQCSLGDAEKSLAAYDLGESIPHYKLYDRTGKLRQTFANEAELKNVDAAVAALLAEEK